MTSIMLMIGTTELLLIAGIALLLFGGKKLPEMMKGMGKGVKSFKEGLNSSTDAPEEDTDPEQKTLVQESDKEDKAETK